MIYPQPLSEQDCNSLFAKLDSPTFVGTPKTETPTSNSNSKMIANKEYVDVSISNLVNAAPAALDTLNELATALGNDPNFATTISNELGAKLNTNSANYIKALSISGKTITYTRGNDTTGTLTTQDTVYTHPTTSGNKHIPAGGSSGQFLKWSSDGTAVWAADNDTHWTTHLYAGATGTAAHASTSNGSTYLVLADESGSTKNIRNNIRITGSGATTVSSNSSGVITISSTDNNTTYSNFVKSGSTAAAGLVPKPPTTAGTTKYLREDGTWQVPPDNNTTYSNFVKSGSSAAAGLVPKPSTTAGTTRYLREDCTWQVPPDTNTTYSVFVKSGSTAAAGLVPKPSTTAGTSKYLREDCTWSTPPNTTYSVVSTTANGLAPKLAGGTTKYLRADGTWAVPPDTNTTYTAASATPKAPGTAAVGSSVKYAREDHVHPLQTTISGNAATATKLANPRTITVKITLNGNTLTGSADFDGSGNITINLGSLTSSQLGVTSGGGSSGGSCYSSEYEGCCCDCAGEGP
jgi:hypothetical protein